MCLILLAFRAHPDMALLLAGNRDEFHSRPSQAPAVIHSDPLIYAGKDLEAGGTWMGRNGRGMMAALTNRRGRSRHIPPDVRSRGEIVVELLCRNSPAEAAEWLAAQDVARYRPFNVLMGDASRFFYFGSEEGEPPRELAPGYYALSNSSLDDRSWPKVDRSLRFFEANQGLSGEELLLALRFFLGDATPPDALQSEDQLEEIHGALGAVFIKASVYGTVSSSILTSGGRLGDRFYFAEASDLAADPEHAFRLVDFSA